MDTAQIVAPPDDWQRRLHDPKYVSTRYGRMRLPDVPSRTPDGSPPGGNNAAARNTSGRASHKTLSPVLRQPSPFRRQIPAGITSNGRTTPGSRDRSTSRRPRTTSLPHTRQARVDSNPALSGTGRPFHGETTTMTWGSSRTVTSARNRSASRRPRSTSFPHTTRNRSASRRPSSVLPNADRHIRASSRQPKPISRRGTADTLVDPVLDAAQRHFLSLVLRLEQLQELRLAVPLKPKDL